MTDRDHFAAADDMVRRALSRKREWEEHGPARWGYGVAVDMLALERRVSAIEQGNRPEKPDSSRDDAPGEGWRWVEPHEPLESGDQFLSLVGRGWLPAKCYGDGRPSAYHRFFRRRIDAKTHHYAAPEATMADAAERSAPIPGPVSAPRDILDEARDFLRPFGSADEVVRYPTAALVLRLADELREMRGAVAKLRRLRVDAEGNMNRAANAREGGRWQGFIEGIDASIYRLEMHAGE
jgi:hypothetical protein